MTLSIAFSSCKKDEDNPSETGLPSGNYVKLNNSTTLEKDWVAIEKLYDPAGERYSNKIYLDQNKTVFVLVTFHGQPIVGNPYFLDGNLGLDKTDRAAVGYRTPDGKNYGAVNNGSLTVTSKDGVKIIELHGELSFGSNEPKISIDSRFQWVP